MQKRQLPIEINILRLAEQRASLTGTFLVKDMPRVGPMLANLEGQANFTLEFGIDVTKRRFIQGQVSAVMNVICQRCLKNMPCIVEDVFLLSPVSSEQDEESLPENYEPILVVGEEQPLMDIIEDELILRIPLVVTHRPNECSIEQTKYEFCPPQEKNNPFSMLVELKKE
jgi:uncharacterized protein